MIVDSNISASIQYVDPTYQVSLFVRANIYDLSGGSPVFDSSVNLLQINNGVYAGKKTFTAAKPYLIQKLVYTDGTYTVVDQSYAQGTDDVQCIDLKTANIDAAISSRNSTAHFDTILGTPVVSVSADLAEIEAETDGIALIPTNPLLTTDVRLNNLDATISSRATQTSVNSIPTNPLLTTDVRLNNLDATISSRATQTSVNSIPTNPLLTTDVRLNHLDADISTRLPTSSYVAPDNADILLIKAKTDNLPVDPASNTQVNTRNSTAHFDAIIGTPVGTVSSDIAEVEADIDLIPTNPLLTSDVRLNNLDATISSRLATAGYTAPDNADIVLIKAKTDQLLFDGDTGVLAHVLNGGGGSSQPLIGTNSFKLESTKLSFQITEPETIP